LHKDGLINIDPFFGTSPVNQFMMMNIYIQNIKGQKLLEPVTEDYTPIQNPIYVKSVTKNVKPVMDQKPVIVLKTPPH